MSCCVLRLAAVLAIFLASTQQVFCDSDLEKKIRVVGIIRSNEEPDSAILEDLASGEQEVVVVGQAVFNYANVLSVDKDGVWLKTSSKGLKYFLPLLGGKSKTEPSSPQTISSKSASELKSVSSVSLENSRAYDFLADIKDFDVLLRSPSNFLGDLSSYTPAVETVDGVSKVTGFTVNNPISCGVLSRLNVDRGDVITAINGHPISNANDIQAALGDVTGNAVTVSIKRDGFYTGRALIFKEKK